MSATWQTIAALSITLIATKAIGPVALGGRDLPAALMRFIGLLAPSILAALIVVGTLTAADGDLEIDARLAGVGVAAGILVTRRSALLPAVAAAAMIAAAVRAVA